jgi:enolase
MRAMARIHAREVLDSRGNPTVEVDLRDGSRGSPIRVKSDRPRTRPLPNEED